MKTSILVSTFSALYFLITFAGTSPHHNDVNKNETVCSYSFIPSPYVAAMETESMPTGDMNESTVKVVVPTIEDFHYLKFEVASYMTDNEMPDEETGESAFDYLKFIVPQSAAYNELTPDLIELPVNEFEYLKFGIKNYSDNQDLNCM